VNRNPTTRWGSLLPGAADNGAFSAVGHCLFALTAGLFRIAISRRCQAKLDSVERDDHAIESQTAHQPDQPQP
jgi:hypothetical protein